METNSKSLLVISILIFTIIVLNSPFISAQDKKFAEKGVVELGGNISFQSFTPVSNGNTGTATTIFTLAPFIGIFVADGFEIGLNPLGITSLGFSGGSITQIRIFVAPSYNFKTNGTAHPFIEALLGYTAQSNGTSASGFSYGGRGGVKIEVTEKGLLNLGIQYLLITLNRSGEPERTGTNELSISAGFTVWF